MDILRPTCHHTLAYHAPLSLKIDILQSTCMQKWTSYAALFLANAHLTPHLRAGTDISRTTFSQNLTFYAPPAFTNGHATHPLSEARTCHAPPALTIGHITHHVFSQMDILRPICPHKMTSEAQRFSTHGHCTQHLRARSHIVRGMLSFTPPPHP